MLIAGYRPRTFFGIEWPTCAGTDPRPSPTGQQCRCCQRAGVTAGRHTGENAEKKPLWRGPMADALMATIGFVVLRCGGGPILSAVAIATLLSSHVRHGLEARDRTLLVV